MAERAPGVWRLRVYVGDDPLTGAPLQLERTFRGGEKDARAALAAFVTDAHSMVAGKSGLKTTIRPGQGRLPGR